MLHDLLGAQVVHRNSLVPSAHHHALVQRVEGGVGDRPFKRVKLLTLLTGLYVPYDQLLVFPSRAGKTHVGARAGVVNPVLMPHQPSLELKRIHIPHFDALVVTGCEEGLAVAHKLDRLHRGSVALDGLGFGAAAGEVQFNRGIV